MKLTRVPQKTWDRCVLVDLFSEVTAMEMFATDKRICELCVLLCFWCVLSRLLSLVRWLVLALLLCVRKSPYAASTICSYHYGTDGENYWLVMKQYRCSLKHWRERQELPLSAMLSVYLAVFAQCVDAVQLLRSHSTLPHLVDDVLVVCFAHLSVS